MSPQEANLVEKIENLRNRIDILRLEIWKRERANLTATQVDQELESLLVEYTNFIRNHSEIAC